MAEKYWSSWCKRVCLLVVVTLFCVSGFINDQKALASTIAPDGTVRVLAIGGSSAHGWDDPHHQSYLLRAFRSLSTSADFSLRYDDKTIPGSPAVSLSGSKLSNWLSGDKPQFVLISWGILDDIQNRTPISAFKLALRNQIRESLSANAKVLVVTPPVVEATVGNLEDQYAQYVRAEYQTVQSLDSANAYWFDLHRQTLSYIQAHDFSVSQFCANGWHPNGHGQATAGDLLFADVNNRLLGTVKVI